MVTTRIPWNGRYRESRPPSRARAPTGDSVSYTQNPGAIAQLGERLLCKQEVTGSIPVGSTAEVPANGPVLARNGGLCDGYGASKCGAAAQPLPKQSPEEALLAATSGQVRGSESPGEGRAVLHREQCDRLRGRWRECCLSSLATARTRSSRRLLSVEVSTHACRSCRPRSDCGRMNHS